MRPACKSCMNSVFISEEVIDELLTEAKIDRNSIVPNKVYLERLQQCQNCPSLMDGTTCMHSGNLVHFTAKINRSTCPFPGRPNWSSFRQLA
jgi:hypothetical protein